MGTLIREADDAAIADAVQVLRSGGLVAMPTETVYGLSCDASNGAAVARLYAAKGRPSFNPLIAHVSSAEMAGCEGAWNDGTEALARAFWPGPLTLVLPRRAETGTVCDLARAGLDTIALRSPRHDVADRLITAFGGPLVAPSANPSGRISPTRAEHVADDLGGLVDLVLDGGPCTVGVESTIVSLTTDTPVLLRPGGLDPRAIEQVLGTSVTHGADDPAAPSSPGQLLRHYAPSAELRLNASGPRNGEAFLAFGPAPEGVSETASLSPTGDLAEAAAALFAALRDLDQRWAKIAVAHVPNAGLGLAINDRLRRAANGAAGHET